MAMLRLSWGIPSRRRIITALLAIAALALAGYIVKSLYHFANLFSIFQPHSGIRISQDGVSILHNQSSPDPRPQVVPKIVHQIFHNWKDPGNDTLPAHWQEARQTCIDLNPDWQHHLWFTDNSHKFLEDHFSWFVDTYDGYKFPIQRVDVLRYFLLRHYGGIYMDMDNGCAASLEPMTYLPAFTTDGGHGALSNNIIGGQPGHPYFTLLTEHLMSWNWNWFLPYVIISYTSGQWFVTAMWEKYHALLQPDGTVRGFEGAGWAPLHHVLMDSRAGHDPWVFFTQVHGGTWSNWDSAMFGYIGKYIIFIVGGVAVVAALAIWCCVRCCCPRRRKTDGYKQLPEERELTEV